MTPHGIVTKATLADARECAELLRPQDRRELEDLSGHDAYSCLARGVLMGSPSWAMRAHSGDMVGLLSVVPWGSRIGVVGMSGTVLIEDNRTAFLRGSRDLLAALDARYDTLLNVCDARNEVHHQWLKWLGFTFIRRIETYGARGVPVYEFARIRPCANP